jgi:cell division septation protein DedD
MFQSPQAITISIFYFIMFLIVSFLAFKSLPFVDALKVLAPFLLTTLLLIYDTDCLVTGGCYVYSWIRTVLYLISIIIVINIVSLTVFTASSIATVTTTTTPATTTPATTTPATTTPATTTPATTTPATTTPATTTKPEEKKTETPATGTPSGTTTKTTEKFALWENYSDINDNEDFTQMF